MTSYDADKAARVWQRVRQEPGTPDLQRKLLALLTQEWTAAGQYLALARRLPGVAAPLQALARQAQGHAACLQGILRLITGARQVAKTPPPAAEPAESALRRYYGQAMKTAGEYEALRSHPEYGPVFARLASESWDRCRTLVDILGNL